MYTIYYYIESSKNFKVVCTQSDLHLEICLVFMLCGLSKHNKKGVNSASQNIEGMVSFENKNESKLVSW